MYGWNPQKPTKLYGNDTTTPSLLPISCSIFLPLTQICFVFVSCVQRRVMEGNQVGSGGCVVDVDVHGE